MSKIAINILAALTFTILIGIWGCAWAGEAPPLQVSVRFGVMLNGRDPKAGEVTCSVDRPCTLLDDSDIKLALKLKSTFGDDDLLEVHCVHRDCSFENGKGTVGIHEGWDFDLYEGKELTEVLLVLKPRTKIGSVMIRAVKAP